MFICVFYCDVGRWKSGLVHIGRTSWWRAFNSLVPTSPGCAGQRSVCTFDISRTCAQAVDIVLLLCSSRFKTGWLAHYFLTRLQSRSMMLTIQVVKLEYTVPSGSGNLFQGRDLEFFVRGNRHMSRSSVSQGSLVLLVFYVMGHRSSCGSQKRLVLDSVTIVMFPVKELSPYDTRLICAVDLSEVNVSADVLLSWHRCCVGGCP